MDTRIKFLGVVTLSLLTLGSPSLLAQGPVVTDPSRGETGAAAPTLRLDDTARPLRYAADLTVVPDRDTFAGVITIDLELRRETPLLWLNGTRLKVREARLEVAGRPLALRLVPGNEEFVGFALQQPVGPGAARLRVAYEGVLSDTERDGLFRRKEGADHYAFTHLEPTYARWVFPCFDEPGFKVPWQLTLHVKREHVALSNTPIVSETEEASGMKAVRFATTKPLPSYLIAVAVGPFEIVDAGKAGKKGTSIRIITPRGRTDQARYAARVTPEILKRLEAYFGTPYPFEKLDQVAVPRVGGAMENPGLVTYEQTGILCVPEKETPSFHRGFARVCAHELAHQWFGNLVTLAWWDDLWLNEAFATWMPPKILGQWHPEWQMKLESMHDRMDHAMSADSLTTARRIRQPITSRHDIRNAFDPITYAKGAAVLEMFESWVGEKTFQRGVRRYLAKHAGGNATAREFVTALEAAAGRDLAPLFSSFLDQAGLPLITVELSNGAGASPRLLLKQERYLPLGSPGSANQTWKIPVQIQYDAGGTVKRQWHLLTSARTEILLATTTTPQRVLINSGQTGYYRVCYEGDLLSRLLTDGARLLAPVDRVGIANDISALVRSGKLPAGQALTLAPRLHRTPESGEGLSPSSDAPPGWRAVITETFGIVLRVRELVPEGLRPSYARYICQLYGEPARALGWRPRPGEDEETRLLRLGMVTGVAMEGEDPVLIAGAQRLTQGWLKDRRSLEPEMLIAVLSVAARNGNRALFEQLLATAREAQDPRERRQLLQIIGRFRDPEALQAAFSLVLTDELHPEERFPLLIDAGFEERTRVLAYEFVKRNIDALLAKLPERRAAALPNIARGFSDPERLADVEAFFKERAAKLTGGPRILAQTLEQIRLNHAFKQAQQASVKAFLKSF